MKGICFAFDAFGKWSEHYRSKMKRRMKVGVDWRSSMAGRLKNDRRPATIYLISSFPLDYLPL
jgi:hypothetical protein